MGAMSSPRVPVRWFVAFIAMGCTFLAGKAAIGDAHSFGEHFVSDGLGVLAGVGFAAAGLTELSRRALRRSWTRSMGPVVRNEMGLVAHELAAAAAACFAIIEPLVRDRHLHPIGWAFNLPTSETQRLVREGYDEAFNEVSDRVAGDAQASQDTKERGVEYVSTIEQHISRCVTLLGRLEEYSPDQAQELREISAQLQSYLQGFQQRLADPRAAGPAMSQLQVLFVTVYRAALTVSACHEAYSEDAGEDLGLVLVTGPHA
jgi:hypothetical protein